MTEQLTVEDVAKVVEEQHEDGMDAKELADHFIKQGRKEYEVQRVIQRAFQKGILQLGPKLRLIRSSQVKAA